MLFLLKVGARILTFEISRILQLVDISTGQGASLSALSILVLGESPIRFQKRGSRRYATVDR